MMQHEDAVHAVLANLEMYLVTNTNRRLQSGDRQPLFQYRLHSVYACIYSAVKA